MSYPVFYPIADDTLPIPFATYDGGDGSSITATGLAVTDIEIYKDGDKVQRASDNGYALLDDGMDFDDITGIHGFSIDLSDNSDAGFYTVGPWYWVIVSAITVDGQTVSFIAAMFRIVSATRGMAGTAVPAVAAGAAGGLPTDSCGKTSFNDLSAADVVTALGTGSTLTACITATGFSTHNAAAVVSALGTGSTLTACATATSVTVSDKTGFALASDGADSLVLPANIITAASIKTGALTADAFAADAIVAATFATGALTADAFAADAIVAASIATGALTADAFAADALVAATFATNSIAADALAADAVEEIRDAITGGAYALDTDSNGRVRVITYGSGGG